MLQKPIVSVILLAGGVGTRMMSSIPKQFLMLQGRAMARHSFDLFLSLPYIVELIVVCDPKYRSFFPIDVCSIPVHFAEPGQRRQDSVFNGFQMVSRENSLVCVHDGARPLLTAAMMDRIVSAAQECGAAIAGVPVKATIKVSDHKQMVVETPDRSNLWEIQTPQIIRYDLLKAGLVKAQQEGRTITDDAALVELIGGSVKIVEGAYTNIKVTTPEDLMIAEQICTSIN